MLTDFSVMQFCDDIASSVVYLITWTKDKTWLAPFVNSRFGLKYVLHNQKEIFHESENTYQEPWNDEK